MTCSVFATAENIYIEYADLSERSFCIYFYIVLNPHYVLKSLSVAYVLVRAIAKWWNVRHFAWLCVCVLVCVSVCVRSHQSECALAQFIWGCDPRVLFARTGQAYEMRWIYAIVYSRLHSHIGASHVNNERWRTWTSCTNTRNPYSLRICTQTANGAGELDKRRHE